MRQQDWALLPYNAKKIKDHYLLSSFLGNWAVVNENDFYKINRLNFFENPYLVSNLKNNGLLLSKSNLDKIADNCRQLHANFFTDVGLHIAVITEKCNFGCLYCQSKNNKSRQDMKIDTGVKILEYLFSSRNSSLRLEFQGGEPLLNWKVLQFMVKDCAKQNKVEKKNLLISLVTNGSLLDKKKAEFLLKHNVDLCISLDGPRKVHNLNRVFAHGKEGTYDQVIKNLITLKKMSRNSSQEQKIGALPTVTKFSFPFFEEIIDEYVRLGFGSIHLRPLNRLGMAKDNWEKIGYSPEEFNSFWKNSLDYIIELNKKGVKIKEEMTALICKKILKKKDPLYVDLESPCGAGRSQLAYSPKGDVYTCDEARMLGVDIFKLGNVNKQKYEDVMKNQNLFYTQEASLSNLWDYNSVFSSWIGTCPVMNYYEQKNPVVKITMTPRHKIYNYQFEYIFEKIIYDKEAKKIFNSWMSN